MLATKGPERKGVVMIGDEGDQPHMTFTPFGKSVYKRCLGDRAPW